MAELPVVDFSVYHLDQEDPPSDSQLQGVAGEIRRALSQYGFLYLRNTGVSERLLNETWDKAIEFFRQPDELKAKYVKEDPGLHGGYLPPERETGYTQKFAAKVNDHGRHCFRYPPLSTGHAVISEEDAPDLMKNFHEVWDRGMKLGLRVLECLSLALNKERSFICDNFYAGLRSKTMDSSIAMVRWNYYEHMDQENEAEDEVRFVAHKDFGIITLLHANSYGLQAQLQDGSWTNVAPREGCIMVQAGLVLENWTSREIKALNHRVVSMKQPAGEDVSRKTTVWFVEPDQSAPVLSFSDRSSTCTFAEHLKTMYQDFLGSSA